MPEIREREERPTDELDGLMAKNDESRPTEEGSRSEGPRSPEVAPKPVADPREEEEARQDKRKKDPFREILEYIRLILIVVLLSVLISQFVVQRNTVMGNSMYPTLKNGDDLIVEKISRYFGHIRRGDIITVDTKGLDAFDPNRVIKRVIALPGETVEIRDDRVFVNSQLLDEPYLASDVVTQALHSRYASVRLGPDEFYCMGDNRRDSKDSRSFGPVPADHILGSVLLRFYPFDQMGKP